MELFYRILHCFRPNSAIFLRILLSLIFCQWISCSNSNQIHNDDHSLQKRGDPPVYKDHRESHKISFSFVLSDDPNDVRFYLYRDQSFYQELLFHDTESMKNSSFKSNEKTVFVIHGFMSNSSSPTPQRIKNAYLQAGLAYNIILVDWGLLSTPEPNLKVYMPIAYSVILKRNIPIASQRIAKFIQFLTINQFTELSKVHIIGHSLGSHISGAAGSIIASTKNGKGEKVGRVTGLDPAGPLFDGIPAQECLTKDDATFVDIYHTAVGTLGTRASEGHANFFPNGGSRQPGCLDTGMPWLEKDFGSCSHSFVSKIYAASILKNFTACHCDPDFVDYGVKTSCKGSCTTSVLAGEPCPSSARGEFYFVTSSDPLDEDQATTEKSI